MDCNNCITTKILAMASLQLRQTLTVPEMELLYGVSRRLIYDAIETGQIPARKIGGKWLIHKKMLDDSFVTEMEKRKV